MAARHHSPALLRVFTLLAVLLALSAGLSGTQALPQLAPHRIVLVEQVSVTSQQIAPARAETASRRATARRFWPSQTDGTAAHWPVAHLRRAATSSVPQHSSRPPPALA